MQQPLLTKFKKSYEIAQVQVTIIMKEFQGLPTIMLNKLNKSTNYIAQLENFLLATSTRLADYRNAGSNCYCYSDKHSAGECKFCQLE